MIIIWAAIIINDVKTPYDVSSNGEVRNRLTGKILKQTTSENGYKRIGLCCYDKEKDRICQKIYLVHRLVAFAFIYNPDPITKTHVNHIDGNKTNNDIMNLEWVTPSENRAHALYMGLAPQHFNAAKGERSGNNKYPEQMIRDVCMLLEKGCLSNIEIAKRTGITPQMVYEIKIGNAWKHISEEYNIPDISRKHPTNYSSIRPLIKDLLKKGLGYRELLEFKPRIISKKSWNNMVYRLKKKLEKENKESI